MAKDKSKSTDKIPARKMPKGFKMTPKKPTPKATAKATAKTNAKPKPKPMTEAQRQAKAMDDLMKKRKAVAKKTGTWPNYGTN